MEIGPGAFHFSHYLDVAAQLALVERCRALVDGAVPAYVPVVRGGGTMHVRMLCLGRHWNGKTYRYETHRTDYDNLPAPPLPADFAQLASGIARSAGMTLAPDLCILNYYDADGRMGLHQDKDESERSIAAGLPVVSISLGDTARFLFGGLAPEGSGRVAAAGVRRRVRLRRPGAPALSRRVAHRAGNRAAGARAGRPVQPDLQAVRRVSRSLRQPTKADVT